MLQRQTTSESILEAAFWALGSEFGMIGNAVASFLSGMLSYWQAEENTPVSLNSTFSGLWLRLAQTSIEVDTQLAQYHADVVGNWNTSFTYNGQTTSLADLASIDFPAEDDPQFEAMAGKSLFGLDQSVWKTVLTSNFAVTKWEDVHGPTIIKGDTDPPDKNTPPVGWDNGYIQNNPAYYNTWAWHDSTGCGDTTGWLITSYNLGTGGIWTYSNTDGSISADACHYLFIDASDDHIINPHGLYLRRTVFNDLGIKKETYTQGGINSNTSVSLAYLRAMKAGQTLGLLIEREGREAVAQRVIEKAQQDSGFAMDLHYRPRQTLEKFLGIRIPEVVNVNVIVETPRNFGVVIPMAEKKSQ